MARAIEFNTEEEAVSRSEAEAESRGCGEGSITKSWWRVSEATSGKWCCWIGVDEVLDAVIERTKA